MRHEGEFTTRGFSKGKKVPKKYKKIGLTQIYSLIRAANPKAEWLRGKEERDFTAAIMAWGRAMKQELYDKGIINLHRIGTLMVFRKKLTTKRMQYKETYELWEADPEAYREGRIVVKKYQEVVQIKFKGRNHLKLKVSEDLMRELNRRVREGEQEVIFE